MNVSKIAQIKDELEQELLREPSLQEIEEAIDDPALKEDVHHLHTIIRLDLPRTEAGDATLHEVLARNEDDLEKRMGEFKRDFLEIIEHFPEREQEIICMYHGIGYDRTYNLREIGTKLDLTRERIRQIKEQTIEKIKKKPEGKKLIEYL